MIRRYCDLCQREHKYCRQAAPDRETWRDSLRDAGEIVGGILLFGSAFVGIPFLLLVIGQ